MGAFPHEFPKGFFLAESMTHAANHGYLSRDGITTFAEAANACQMCACQAESQTFIRLTTHS